MAALLPHEPISLHFLYVHSPLAPKANFWASFHSCGIWAGCVAGRVLPSRPRQEARTQKSAMAARVCMAMDASQRLDANRCLESCRRLDAGCAVAAASDGRCGHVNFSVYRVALSLPLSLSPRCVGCLSQSWPRASPRHHCSSCWRYLPHAPNPG